MSTMTNNSALSAIANILAESNEQHSNNAALNLIYEAVNAANGEGLVFGSEEVTTTTLNVVVNFIDISMPNNSYMDLTVKLFGELNGHTQYYMNSYTTRVHCNASGTVSVEQATSSIVENFTNNPTFVVLQSTPNHYLLSVSSGAVSQTVNWKSTFFYVLKQF